jgi:hypothetical protein
MKAVPLELKEANRYVEKLHRHHDPVHRDKFRCGVVDNEGNLRGVVQVGRPVARMLQDGNTVEVVRLCTDGYKNACSFLYARAAQAAKALGYKKIITYILDSELGASLKAAGWVHESDVRGHEWDCPSRPRNTTAPTDDKQRWAKYLT